MATLKLEVATPDGLALDTQVEIVTAPSVEGEFGVLPGHLPLLAATRSGVLKYRVDGKEQLAAVGPGFVEAGADHVLLLTSRFLAPAAIDRGEAEKDLAEAEAGIAGLKTDVASHEYQELAQALEWARARVEAVRAGA